MKDEATPPAPLRTVSLTVGTAGHIDHGKTALVKCLTGCDTDTLPEEKARGMTIDLGFATCELPDHRRVGIVDVPGHERFIHNMVAGAAGIDAVMLVVAADDGIMPQTIEHFHIVRLLGLRSGLVVLNKIDLATPERVRDVERQVRELIKGSFLESCPIVAMSTKTGEGFSEFYDAFVATVRRTAERDAGGPFRLHVERSFILKGLGTIVSGIPRSGSVRLGDTVALLPQGAEKKVRGIQVFGVTGDCGRAGECVALRLSDLDRDEVKRGMVVASPGYFTPARFINARFQLMPGLTRPLLPRTSIRFHSGTEDVPGHLVLPELEPLRPGEESYVQLQLSRPVVAAPGDFFVVRLLSPVLTLGGGYVLAPDTMRMRRSRGTWEGEVRKQEDAHRSPEAAVRYALEQAGGTPADLAQLAHTALVNEEAAAAELRALAAQGEAVELPGGRFAGRAALEAARGAVLAALNAMHDAQPLSLGFPRKDFLPKVAANRMLVDHALEQLLGEGALAVNDTGCQIPARAPRLSPKQAALAESIEGTYRRAAFAAPRLDELPALIGAPEPILAPVIRYLMQAHVLADLGDRVVLHRAALELARQKAVEWFQTHDAIEVGDVKELTGATRKFVIPLLEHWDRTGFTRRDGNKRVLKKTG